MTGKRSGSLHRKSAILNFLGLQFLDARFSQSKEVEELAACRTVTSHLFVWIQLVASQSLPLAQLCTACNHTYICGGVVLDLHANRARSFESTLAEEI